MCELNSKWSEKQSNTFEHLCQQKILIVCVCVCVCVCVSKWVAGQKYLLKKEKLLLKHTLKRKFIQYLWKKRCSDFYIIWVKVIDLQKRLGHRNVCHVAMNKTKSFCETKYLTKEQVRRYKRKMSQWIDNRKSVYIHEDLA